MNIPYTYLIGWPELNLWYYGVRYSNNCHPNDLWVSYFTSSKYVTENVSKYGNPSVRQIRKTFKNSKTPVKDAREWERRVLQRMKVVLKEEWINKHDRPAPPILIGDNNPQHTNPEIRKKTSEGVLRLGENHPSKRSESRKRHSEWNATYWTEERKRTHDNYCGRGTVAVTDLTGDSKRIPKIDYDQMNRNADVTLWEYVAVTSKESKRRRLIKNMP